MACALMQAACGAFKVRTLHRGRCWIVKRIPYTVTTVENYLLSTAKYNVSLSTGKLWFTNDRVQLTTKYRLAKIYIRSRSYHFPVRETAFFACWMGHNFPSSSVSTSRSIVTTFLAPHPFLRIQEVFSLLFKSKDLPRNCVIIHYLSVV